MLNAFGKTEDAIFYGREAEGPLLNLETVFVVGHPPTDLVYAACRNKLKNLIFENLGLYIGAGCRNASEDVFGAKELDRVLKNLYKEPGPPLYAVTIETRDFAQFSDYKEVSDSHTEIDSWLWMVPMVYPDFQLPVEEIDAFRKCIIPGRFGILGKVYLKNFVLVTPLRSRDVSLGDYDRRAEQYRKDQIFWSSAYARGL